MNQYQKTTEKKKQAIIQSALSLFTILYDLSALP